MYPPAVRSAPCSPKRSVAEFNQNLTFSIDQAKYLLDPEPTFLELGKNSCPELHSIGGHVLHKEKGSWVWLVPGANKQRREALCRSNG